MSLTDATRRTVGLSRTADGRPVPEARTRLSAVAGSYFGRVKWWYGLR